MWSKILGNDFLSAEYVAAAYSQGPQFFTLTHSFYRQNVET
jgi:hypothetical protein